MRDRTLRNEFKHASADFSSFAKEGKRELSLHRIRQEAEQKQMEMPPSPVQKFMIQLCYMNKFYLLFPILMILILLGTVRTLGSGTLQERELLAFVSAGISLIGLFGVIGIGRIFAYHMGELQMCCFWGIGEIAAMRMILSGFVNGCLILTSTFVLKGWLQREFLEILLYILTPFVFSNCIYFGVFLFAREKGAFFPLAAVGILTCSFWIFFMRYSLVYEREMYLFWILALLVSAFFFCTEIFVFFCRLKKGEIVCLL